MNKLKENNEHLSSDDDPADAVDPFQDIMEQAGNHGRFQIIYNIIFIVGLAMGGALNYMNIILALNIPDHWCTVPGHNQTNFTLEEWRNLTLPKDRDNRGAEKFSSCQMYNVNHSDIHDWDAWKISTNRTVEECQHGWSYDDTWYDKTIASQEDWVCSRDLYVTNVFVVTRITEVFGSFVLGQMGDVFGRRLVYYISVISCTLGRMFSIVTTDSYVWFLIFSGIAGFAINSLFQSPQIVGMEISREEDRSSIAIYQALGWSIGTSVMPLLFWWLRDWVPFMWITTAPTAIILIFSKYVIESPRWLINKRRFREAIVQFKKIAKLNGRQFNITEEQLAQRYASFDEDKTYGMASLFSGWRLSRNTIIMAFSWCVVAVSYFTLVLFSSRMGGNPFLNFLLQSLVEIPAYFMGKYMGDKYGRRFTNSSSFLVSFFACIPIIIYASDEKYEYVMTIIATFIKFLNSLTFFTVNLQSMEIYPTCMRQTGIALGTIVANGVGVLAPYLVYLGTTVDIRAPYYILGVLFLLGGIGATFLPETLHKKLPDTLEEARLFGIHDKYFSLPKKPVEEEKSSELKEKLNQQIYAP